MRYALIQNGAVSTVVEQPNLPTIPGQWVACGDAGPGWAYNGSAFAPPPPITYFSLSLRAFWRRFLPVERENLQEILLNGTAAQKRKLGAFREYLAAGGDVELNDDYVRSSVTLMESATVLAAGRATIILDTPVTDAERA
jgi:hypothetical protein